MATFTESTVHVEVRIARDVTDGTDHVVVSATSFASDGTIIRRFVSDDIFQSMSLARKAQVDQILTDAINYVKNQLNIP